MNTTELLTKSEEAQICDLVSRVWNYTLDDMEWPVEWALKPDYTAESNGHKLAIKDTHGNTLFETDRDDLWAAAVLDAKAPYPGESEDEYAIRVAAMFLAILGQHILLRDEYR